MQEREMNHLGPSPGFGRGTCPPLLGMLSLFDVLKVGE
jgi:hypothetical protein